MFGQGENSQLGNGSRANSHTTAVVEALPTHERVQAVACGLFYTAAVTESGDVWVWGMEGGLGQYPGIEPPGSKSGDALTPVRVFGESAARYNPKGIACGAAHTVTVANAGKDLWVWRRGKNGVLGLGHSSNS
jgi:alpha-tubulin suppressor-like RCC1 family protein